MSALPTFRPVSPIFGAEVLGVDLRDEPNENCKARLREAWYEHALLVFRGQQLDEKQCDRACEIFGEISYEGDYSSYVSNVVANGLVPDGELLFHMDFSFSDDPLRGIMLYGFEVPPEGAGGETLFANVNLAYEQLLPAVRERIDKLTIVHSTLAIKDHDQTKVHKTSYHPIAYPHPVTGEIVLFCSPRHFLKVEGLSPEDSEKLCRELESYIARPEIAYEHKWRPGDLVVWDNLKLQHARRTFDKSHRRHLRRTQIAARAAVPV